MMDRNEFYKYIQDNVKNYLPPAYENARVELIETVKANDIKWIGISIKMPEEQMNPVIYLHTAYDQYRDGKDLDRCVRDVAECRIKRGMPNRTYDISQLADYDAFKDRLRVEICDPELNQERLDDLVHEIHGDYASLYYVDMPELDGSIAVTNRLLTTWNVSKEQLHADAIAADKKREPVFCKMSDFMVYQFTRMKPRNLLQEKEYTVPSNLIIPMYYLTNIQNSKGASLIFHEDIMEKIGDILQSDYYVLPSSLHEMIIIPYNSNMPLKEMVRMVHEINEGHVVPEAHLSDKIQFYSREEKVWENAQNRENRLLIEKAGRSRTSIKGEIASAKKEAASAAQARTGQRSESKETVR